MGTGRDYGRRPRTGQLRRMLPAVFLLLSLGVAGFGALEAWSAQRSHRATATGVVTDYGEFALWIYGQRVRALMGAALEGTFAVVHQSRAFLDGSATEQCLAFLLNNPSGSVDCECGTHLTGAYAFHIRLNEPPASGRWRGDGPDAVERVRILAAVRDHARHVYEDAWPFAVLHVDGAAVAYTRVVSRPVLDASMAPVADTLLYGVQVDPAGLEAVMRRALSDEILLPPTLTRGRPNHEVIQVEVHTPAGAPIYASRPGAPHTFPAETELPAILGGGALRASVLPSVADQLVIGGLPGDQTPVLVLIFALAGALAVAAIIQLRRENRLALMRQDFVASVSHELRTPLAQVRLFTETLRLGRARTDEQREWALENIDRETLRLTHLVENVLHFSRADRGLPSLEREPIDVGPEIRDALAAFRPLVPNRRARFECRVPDGLVAEVHRHSFRQVVLNYLDNAVRYGPSGQTIRVVGERDGPWMRLAVIDEGPGVPVAERERIFDPFRRGGSSVGTVVPGSGIGLSVVREIARAHGGRVRVEDAPKGGARFVLEVPALHSAPGCHPRDRTEPGEPDPQGGEPPPGREVA